MTAARAATSRGSRHGWPSARLLRARAAVLHQETEPSRASDDKDDWPCGRHVRPVDGDVHVWDVANLGLGSLGTSFASNRPRGWHRTGCPATNCRTVCLVPRWRCAPCVAARPTAGWAWGWAELGSTPAAAASCRAGATSVRIEGRRRPGTLWKTGGWNASLGQPPNPLLLPTLIWSRFGIHAGLPSSSHDS